MSDSDARLLERSSSDGQLVSVLRSTADFLYQQGVGEGFAAVDDVRRWIETYGEPEEWAKVAQAAHARAERLYKALERIEKGEPLKRYEWCQAVAREALA